MAKAQTAVGGSARLSARHVDEIYRTIRTAIRFGFGAFCVWSVTQAIAALAGQNTSVIVQAGLSAFADLRFVFTFSLAGVAGVWALMERRLRQRATERLHKRVKELETEVDPKRSMSSLTTKGQTNPKDRFD